MPLVAQKVLQRSVCQQMPNLAQSILDQSYLMAHFERFTDLAAERLDLETWRLRDLQT